MIRPSRCACAGSTGSRSWSCSGSSRCSGRRRRSCPAPRAAQAGTARRVATRPPGQKEADTVFGRKKREDPLEDYALSPEDQALEDAELLAIIDAQLAAEAEAGE